MEDFKRLAPTANKSVCWNDYENILVFSYIIGLTSSMLNIFSSNVGFQGMYTPGILYCVKSLFTRTIVDSTSIYQLYLSTVEVAKVNFNALMT